MRRLLLTCFGLGSLPVAPGTWGSVFPVAIFVLLNYFAVPAGITMAVMALLVITSSLVCILLTPAEELLSGRKDPGYIVADEVAGQALTFIPIAMVVGFNICFTSIIGFVLFRLFDILKPWPIRKFEKLPSGWGVLCDDLVAGLYAGIVLAVVLRLGLVNSIAEICSVDFNNLNFISAAVLGAIQGMTEFLPVSSSGHLVLFENIFGLDPEMPAMLLFDLVIHVGTVIAIFIVFRKSIIAFVKNLLSSARYGSNPIEIYKKSPSVHLAVLAIVTTAVTSVVGLSFKHYFESARGSLAVVAAMWFVTATLLLITDRRKKTRMGLRQFGLLAAVIVGLAQAGAIMPGISRSGATICAAILIGLHRRWAVEYSFLIAIPAILGATAVEMLGSYDVLSSANLSLSSMLIGPAVAAIVGVFALKILINVSRRANLKFFAFYCYCLAIILVGYLVLG